MHHANLLAGSHEWGLSQLPPPYRVPSTDVVFHVYDRMQIIHARSLAYETTLRPLEGTHRVFVIVCDSILPEAQNALLKLFEEPNDHTVFYLITPREDVLLPTLRSRLFPYAKEIKAVSPTSFHSFCKAGYQERLSMIQDRLAPLDEVWLSEIAYGISGEAARRKDTALIQDALLLLKYIRGTGSSKKMLLEHIALSL